MVIKGNSRGGAAQLGRHLLRADTNEHIKVLEIQSPLADLTDTLRDWQLLSTGTQQGKKGLYHANINPDHYAMTPEQWLRSVEILEKELGFTGQPRAIVMHEKEGREHLHVVWQRTDIDTMTLRTDSKNYAAHERASLALEIEFGHEPVPGKHAKRDREKQPEFPRAETSHAEKQQAERTKIDLEEMRATVTALFTQSDNAGAFKNALKESGYVLAEGDQRGKVIVDEHGEVYSLTRQITDKEAKEHFKAFMQDIGQLPNVEEAKALQKISVWSNASDHTQTELRIVDRTQKPTAPQSHTPTVEQITRIEHDLKTRYAEEGRELDAQYRADLKRYIEEEELHNRLLEKLEEERRQEEIKKKPDEPDPPKPSL